jgi:hypothetical protein
MMVLVDLLVGSGDQLAAATLSVKSFRGGTRRAQIGLTIVWGTLGTAHGAGERR